MRVGSNRLNKNVLKTSALICAELLLIGVALHYFFGFSAIGILLFSILSFVVVFISVRSFLRQFILTELRKVYDSSLFENEIIKTTVPKAKELRRVAEPLITLAKEDSVAHRRMAFDRLRNRGVVTKLFNELGPRYVDRPGGYLRILKCGFRPGDNAPMAYVELVDRPREEDAVEE